MQLVWIAYSLADIKQRAWTLIAMRNYNQDKSTATSHAKLSEVSSLARLQCSHHDVFHVGLIGLMSCKS